MRVPVGSEMYDVIVVGGGIGGAAAAYFLLEGVKVIAIHEEEGVTAVSEEGREFRGRYLVGADGASSVVARELGLRRGKFLFVRMFNEEIGYGAMMLRIPLYAWGLLRSQTL